ncbi:MAG: hypothetical protein Q8P24_11275 [Desulfobacterales bacterium]|nr:hypothetical protein [Desulfobacterales bacterium]
MNDKNSPLSTVNSQLSTINSSLSTVNSQLLIYQTDDGLVKLDVRLAGETVWLTQQLIAELFQTTIPNISMHIRNIFEEGELTPEATIKKFLTVRREGGREVQRNLEYYNLDMISLVQKAHAEYEKYRMKMLEAPTAVEKHFIEAEKELKQIESRKKRRGKNGKS